jgi:hypothetical protein
MHWRSARFQIISLSRCHQKQSLYLSQSVNLNKGLATAWRHTFNCRCTGDTTAPQLPCQHTCALPSKYVLTVPSLHLVSSSHPDRQSRDRSRSKASIYSCIEYLNTMIKEALSSTDIRFIPIKALVLAINEIWLCPRAQRS